ncbi:GNAT family N-acetyltransferase [Photobacterium sp. 1_MG-2023]|uniref:GNAT family N-acetyltransferase n=1 Tax=Photobacterium sp. 1_MG-2023 TaxID=3062646 RepID=UPI0026E35F31|nr:GNAT family N-acetyltransferase [Photobacterium sp. 1_MG-2023]MDO6708605.1 GNAT family N-acetyltransferase [Photobacterium sp. 1_MG-2023]
MTETIEIRPYTAQDKSDCLAVFQSNAAVYFAPSEYEEFAAFLDSFALQVPYYVVIKAGQLIGCGGVSDVQGVSYLCWGMVHRAYHGTGVGSLLAQYRLDLIRDQQCSPRVQIDTSQHTQGFYARFGFEITEVVHNGFGEEIDRVTMVLAELRR